MSVDDLLRRLGWETPPQHCDKPQGRECRHGKTICHIITVRPALAWCHGAHSIDYLFDELVGSVGDQKESSG